MIPLLLYAQLADLITFGIAVDTLGSIAESNPIQRAIYHLYGVLGVILVKSVIVAIFVFGALAIRHATKRGHLLSGFVAGFGFSIGTLGALSNVVSLAVMV